MPSPQFVIVTPAVEDPDLFIGDLRAVLGATEIAAVIIRLAAAEERVLLGRAKTLVRTVQEFGAAAILDGQFDIVGRSGADGTHVVATSERLVEAVGRFRPEKIVGAGGLRTRHEAMVAGEAGVDYLFFGEAGADRPSPSLDALLDRVAWWSEIFEQPCTALAPTIEAVSALAAAGADFIALGDCIWTAEAGPVSAMRRAVEAMEAADA